MTFEEEYVTFGIVMKIPYGKIKELGKYIEDNDIIPIFNKTTLGKLRLQEITPSSTIIEEVDERDEI